MTVQLCRISIEHGFFPGRMFRKARQPGRWGFWRHAGSYDFHHKWKWVKQGVKNTIEFGKYDSWKLNISYCWIWHKRGDKKTNVNTNMQLEQRFMWKCFDKPCQKCGSDRLQCNALNIVCSTVDISESLASWHLARALMQQVFGAALLLGINLEHYNLL